MKALAFSFTLMQYDAVIRVRDYSAPKFILDVVNNSTLIAVIGPSKTASSIVTTFLSLKLLMRNVILLNSVNII